jgi:hypothetical protein
MAGDDGAGDRCDGGGGDARCDDGEAEHSFFLLDLLPAHTFKHHPQTPNGRHQGQPLQRPYVDARLSAPTSTAHTQPYRRVALSA